MNVATREGLMAFRHMVRCGETKLLSSFQIFRSVCWMLHWLCLIWNDSVSYLHGKCAALLKIKKVQHYTANDYLIGFVLCDHQTQFRSVTIKLGEMRADLLFN